MWGSPPMPLALKEPVGGGNSAFAALVQLHYIKLSGERKKFPGNFQIICVFRFRKSSHLLF
jgi:hypothetical protein